MRRTEILIVEDESIVAEDVRHTLERLGYAVTATALTGEQAIEEAVTSRPDLVLMDIKLRGEMDGVEAAEQINARLDVPVVYLTAYADDETLERAKITEPFGYILKPFEERELHSAIEIALYKHSMERALRESEESYRTILETIEDGYYEVDSAGNLRFFNPALCEILGYSEDELSGMNSREYMDDATAKQVYQAFNSVYRTGEPTKAFDWEIIRKDGSRRFVEASISLVQSPEGEPVGFRGILRDVTERKHMEQALRMHTRQLEALREVGLKITAQLDLKRLLRSIASQAIKLLGGVGGGLYLYQPEQDALELVTAVGRQRVPLSSILHRGENRSGGTGEGSAPLIVDDYQHWEGRALQCEELPVASVVMVPIRWGGEFLGVLTTEGQTGDAFSPADTELLSLFATQAAIAIRNARLYDEVRRQTDELTAAVAKLQELDRLKSEFIQNVSHELRSPLALIRGYAEMLETGELGDMGAMQREPVAIIARRARMLSALVQDITLILEAEVNPPLPEPVPLDEVTRAAVADFQIAAAEAQLTLQTEIASDLPPVCGTPTHLRRVLDNLIENAIKFTPPQGRITVRMKKPREDQILLEVSDTGIGIRSDQQERIFERFYQVDGSTKRRYPGSGLGLALVKEIVETYGGEISVESAVGRGSTFFVTLPTSAQGHSQRA
ncbi:MAG: ATP-binding protein [Anaerolineae bacterium]|jgi:PAS domain S-box-containing protein